MTTEPAASLPSAQDSQPQHPPRRVADWYELFFDLVFVVVIAISAELLEKDTSFAAVLVFLLLLFPLWWAWVNLMVTNNLFGARYGAIGVLVIAAMPGPAAMAIAIFGGMAHYAWLYAVGAAWIRLVLLGMWLVPPLEAGIIDPDLARVCLQPRHCGGLAGVDRGAAALAVPGLGGGGGHRGAAARGSQRLFL